MDTERNIIVKTILNKNSTGKNVQNLYYLFYINSKINARTKNTQKTSLSSKILIK